MIFQALNNGLVVSCLLLVVQARPGWLKRQEGAPAQVVGPRDYSVYSTPTAGYGYTYGGYGPAPTASSSSTPESTDTSSDTLKKSSSSIPIYIVPTESSPASESTILPSTTSQDNTSTQVGQTTSSAIGIFTSLSSSSAPIAYYTEPALSETSSSLVESANSLSTSTTAIDYETSSTAEETTSSAIGIFTSVSNSPLTPVYYTSPSLGETTSSAAGDVTSLSKSISTSHETSSATGETASSTTPLPSTSNPPGYNSYPNNEQTASITATISSSPSYSGFVSKSSPTVPLVCHKNNCLRQMIHTSTLAASFCATYTATINTATTGLPAYVSMCKGSPSTISAACSCLGQLVPTQGGSTTTSEISGGTTVTLPISFSIVPSAPSSVIFPASSEPPNYPSSSSATGLSGSGIHSASTSNFYSQVTFTPPYPTSAITLHTVSNTTVYLPTGSGVTTSSAIGIAISSANPSYYVSTSSAPYPISNASTYVSGTGTGYPGHSTPAVSSSVSPNSTMTQYTASSNSFTTTVPETASITYITSVITVTIPHSIETTVGIPTSVISSDIITSSVDGVVSFSSLPPYPIHNTTLLSIGTGYSNVSGGVSSTSTKKVPTIVTYSHGPSSSTFSEVITSSVEGIVSSVSSAPYPMYNTSSSPIGTGSSTVSGGLPPTSIEPSPTIMTYPHEPTNSLSTSLGTGVSSSAYSATSAPYQMLNSSIVYTQTSTISFSFPNTAATTTSSALGIYTSQPLANTSSSIPSSGYNTSSVMGSTYTLPVITTIYSSIESQSPSIGITTSSAIGIFSSSSAPYAFTSNSTLPAGPTGTYSSTYIAGTAISTSRSQTSPVSPSSASTAAPSIYVYPSYISSLLPSMSYPASNAIISYSPTGTAASVTSSFILGFTTSSAIGITGPSPTHSDSATLSSAVLTTTSLALPYGTGVFQVSSTSGSLQTSSYDTPIPTTTSIPSTFITHTTYPSIAHSNTDTGLVSSNISVTSFALSTSSSSSPSSIIITSTDSGIATSLSTLPSPSPSPSDSTMSTSSAPPASNPPTAPISTTTPPPYYYSYGPRRARRVFGLV